MGDFYTPALLNSRKTSNLSDPKDNYVIHRITETIPVGSQCCCYVLLRV